MAEIAELGFKIDSSQTVKAAKNLDGLTAATYKTETASQRAERQWRQSQATLRGMGRDIQFVTNLMRGFAAGFAGLAVVRHLQRVADGYSNVQAKLRLVTSDQAQLGRVSEQVFALSQRTFSSLDSTATLVSRTTRALISNGAEASAALASSLRLSETIQKAFAVSGATTAEASNAIIQLSQGLSAGALRGEEYNSVAEQGSRITQALAASLGKTTGELREMAAQGELTAEIIQRALTQQAAAIDAEFAKLPLTIERSLVNLENAWSRFVGQADQASGASRAIAEAIAGLARNLEDVADAALVVAGVVAASFAGRALQGVKAYTAAVMQSVAATSASAEMERLAAAASVQSATAKSIDTARTLEVVAAARQEAVAIQAAAAAEVERTKRIVAATAAMGAQSAALQASRVATEQLAVAQARLRATTNDLATLGQQQMRLQAQLAAGAAAQVAAQTRVARALTATQQVMAGMVSTASRLGSGLLALAGGPIGLVILGLGAMYVSMKNSEEAAAAFEGRIKSTTQALDDFARTGTAGDLEALFNPETGGNRAAEMINELNAELRIAQNELANATIRMQEMRGGGAAAQAAKDRIAELTAELERMRPKMDAAAAAFADFVHEALGFGKAARTIARDTSEWFKSMADQEEKLRSQRIELQSGFRAMLEYNATQAAGVKTAAELSVAMQEQITRLVTEKAAIDAANEAKRESAKSERDHEREMRRTEKAVDKSIEAQERYQATLARMRAELKGPLARAEAEHEAQLIDLRRELKAGNVTMSQYEETLGLLDKGHARAAESARIQEEELAKQRGSADALLASMEREIELIGMSADERDRAIAQMQAEEDMTRAINVAREAGAKITDKQAREYTEAARALAAERSEAEKLESILSRFDDIGMSGLVRDIQLIDEAIKKAVESGEQFTNPERFERLQAAAAEYRKEGIDNNIAAMQAGISSLQSMATEGSKAYKALEVASAALNVALAINAILNQGKGDPYTAFARMAAMAAAVASLVGSIVSFSANGPSSSGAEARQAAQGRGTVLGDAEAQSESIAEAAEITADATSELVGIQRGMLRAIQQMQAGISAASGSLARTGFAGLDLAEGAGRSSLFDPLGIGGGTFASRAISAIFGGEQELIDQGLLIRGGAFGSVSRDPRASTYQTIEEEGGWFSSDEISDQMEALGEAATTQIRLILMSIGDTVREAATALGLDADEFNAAIEAFRVEEIRISTMDLTGEEAQEALTAVFSSIFDELAGAVVPWVEQFQRVGEGLGETLIRVATSVQVFQESILQLGLSVGDLEPERLAQVSVALVEAAGGIEQFIAGMQAFVANFAPESHRFAVAQDELTRALAQVGLTLPETRDGMWTLMQSLDATTESGQQQIATLLRLAGVADAYYGMLEDGADAVASAARAAAEAAAEAAEQDAVARALLIGITRERDYANMNTAARAIADVNARFSDLRIQLNATNPTLAEAAELERARMQAIEDANAALLAQADSLIEGLLFEESLVGLTDAQVEIANINREFDDYVLTLLDLGIAMDSTQMATLESIRAARIARVEMEELAEVVTVSFRQMRSSISVFIQDLRTQFEHLMDPGFMNWIEGLTGITRTADSPLVTRAGILEEVAQSYASGIASLSMQLAAAQAELDAMGSVVRGPERAALLGKIENLRQLLGDVSGALGDALDYVNELFEQQIGDLLRTLREEFGSEDEIGKINARFDRLIEQATAWGASMAQLAEIEEFRLIALMRASEDMYASQLDMIRHLQGYLNDMLLGEDSPLSATERVEEAWSQFQDAVATGNAEEATRLADVYLQLLRETQASGDDFNAQFWAVREILTAMRDAAVQSITDDATEQYLADIAAGGVLQLHALERLTAVMDSIRVATGGVLPAGDLSAGGGTGHSYATAAQEKESPAAMAAELALIREELTAVREAVNRGAERVAVSVDKTGERSDRANDQSRGRYAQPSGRSVR